MAGSMFLRSLERSERIYDAMVARGYNGEVRSLRAPALQAWDVFCGTLVALALVVVHVVARLWL